MPLKRPLARFKYVCQRESTDVSPRRLNMGLPACTNRLLYVVRLNCKGEEDGFQYHAGNSWDESVADISV